MKTFVAPWRAGTSSRWNAYVEGSVTAAKLTTTVLRTAISLKHRYTCNVALPPPKHWPLRLQQRSTEGSRVPSASPDCFLPSQIVEIIVKSLFLFGEPAGTRTQDPVIKSHVLYRLSYGLAWPVC